MIVKAQEYMISTDDPDQQKRVYSQMALLLMCFSCLFVLSAQRINMSIVIVDMVNWTAVADGRRDVPCSPTKNYTILIRDEPGKFVWSYHIQCQILACYFYGLALGHWPAEYLASKMKAKWLPLAGTMLASVCNFLTPLAARTSAYLLMFLQFVKAIGQANVIPAFSMLVGMWIDSTDMITFMGCCITALPLGGFLTILGAGILSQSDEWGWQYVFYVSGAMGVVWCCFWVYLASEYFFPTVLIYGSQQEVVDNSQRPRAPLRDIFTSKRVWAFLLCSLATYWAYAFNLLLLPLYTKSVYQADIQWNYIVSSAPNLLQAFLFLAAVMSSERLVGKKIVEPGPVRTFWVVSGFAVFSTCNVLLTFAKCSRGYAGFLNTIAYGFIGLNLAATSALPSDMSPNYGGVLSSTLNTAGPLFGSLLPLLVGILSNRKEGIGNWNFVFYSSALIGFVAMILFLLIGPRKVEPWNNQTRSIGIDGIVEGIERNGYSDLYEMESAADSNGKDEGQTDSVTKSKYRLSDSTKELL